jgi:hypothetical protein
MLPSENSRGEPFPYRLDRNPGPCRDASGNSSSTRNRTAPQRKTEACCCYRYCEYLARHCGSVRIGDYLQCARFGVPFEYYSLLSLYYSGTEEIESTGGSCSGCRNDGTGTKRQTTSRWSSEWRQHEALEGLVHDYRRRHRRHSRRPGQGAKCAL